MVAQKKGNQREEPGLSPGKPHYLKPILKLQVEKLAESKDPRGKT